MLALSGTAIVMLAVEEIRKKLSGRQRDLGMAFAHAGEDRMALRK